MASIVDYKHQLQQSDVCYSEFRTDNIFDIGSEASMEQTFDHNTIASVQSPHGSCQYVCSMLTNSGQTQREYPRESATLG